MFISRYGSICLRSDIATNGLADGNFPAPDELLEAPGKKTVLVLLSGLQIVRVFFVTPPLSLASVETVILPVENFPVLLWGVRVILVGGLFGLHIIRVFFVTPPLSLASAEAWYSAILLVENALVLLWAVELTTHVFFVCGPVFFV